MVDWKNFWLWLYFTFVGFFVVDDLMVGVCLMFFLLIVCNIADEVV
jgi:hypothetical protein